MPWCRFFIPKIASPSIKAGDAELNDNIMYAKCIKGHALRDANDWIQCENLPAPDAKCWIEGGETIFSLLEHRQSEVAKVQADNKQATQDVTPTKTI
ncbi:MAG: hypothetical protein JO011_09065 [Ktedonobacteraceae bacterium]|nr:hypothetical protein [Ktedonobacteraceae bacterium]